MKPRDHPIHLTFTSSTKSGPVGSRSDGGEGVEEGDEEHLVDEGDHTEEQGEKLDEPPTKQVNGDPTHQKPELTNASSGLYPARPEISIVKTSHPPFTPKVDVGGSSSSPMSKRSSKGKNGISSAKGRSSSPATPNTGSPGLYVVKAPPPRPEMQVSKVKRRGGGGGGGGGMNPMTVMLLTGGMQQQQQQQQQQTDNNQSSNC